MEPRDLSDHVAYVPGRGSEEVARERGVDPADLVVLSSNENPLGPSPRAVEAVREAAGEVHAYPKAAPADLRAAVADRWGVAPEQVWLASGADGAIDYLSRAMLDAGDRVLVPRPGFAYYGMSARFHHGEVAGYGLGGPDGDVLAAVADGTLSADAVLAAYDGERVVYATSPHNPTGAVLPVGDVEQVADETGEETLVVVDEAYAEFAERDSAAGLLEERDDVAVLRTFSKAYGLAGLRLGYALVPAAWADAYARVSTPFATSEVACRAGRAALEDEAHLERSVATARRSREHMREAIDAPVYPSEANFVLVDVGAAVGDGGPGEGLPGSDGRTGGNDGSPGSRPADDEATGDGADAPAGAVVAAALQERGVIVRDCTSFGLPDCIRITCGTEEGTRRAVAAVNEVVSG